MSQRFSWCKPMSVGFIISGLLDGTQRAEHPDYETDLNFEKAETDAEQQSLI
jgi:hypothetical protein